MQTVQKLFLFFALVSLAIACSDAAPPPPMTWQVAIVRVQRNMGLRMMAQIRSAPHPAAARELLAPAITLLIRGQLYKEARRLAGTAINAFPTDPLYRQLLAEAYQATIDAGLGSERTLRKMAHERERARQLSQ